MNSAVVLLFASLVTYSSAGGVVVRDEGDGEPKCDISEQLEFQICAEQCVFGIANTFPADVKDSDDALRFITCIATCHLKPLGFAPPSPGEPKGSGSLDDLLKFTICYKGCYSDWVTAMETGSRTCFQLAHIDLGLCYYDCVQGNYQPRRNPPPGIEKREVARSKRAVDTFMKMKARYVLCYVNCFEKDNEHNILRATGYAPVDPPATCKARDTVLAGQCNGRCYDRAVNGRTKRATDSEATYDRLNNAECVSVCLRDMNYPSCPVRMIFRVNVCINRCLIKKFKGQFAPALPSP